MAGLHCGYAIAAPATIARLRALQSRNSINAAALIAARASLGDLQWVETSKKRNSATRGWLTGEMARLGLRTIPSEANFVMIDLGEPIEPASAALRNRGILVGRRFPPYANHLRVTIGKPQEMERFVRELAAVREHAPVARAFRNRAS
jgi:histidinol-phosphate aminotransferase